MDKREEMPEDAQEQWKRKHGDEISWFRDFSFRTQARTHPQLSR